MHNHKRPYNITKYITICNEETLFPNSYAERDKKRSQIISIYGCNPSLPEGNVVFFIIHWISDKAWTTDDAYMINVLVGYKRPSAFGVLIAAGCVHSAFDFLSKLRCQGTTVQRKNPREDRAVSPHSLSARDSGHHPDPEASPHLGRNPVLFTHPTTPPHSSNISSLAYKAAESGGRLVFGAVYQRGDARLREPFVRSDALRLPSEDYETTLRPGASSLTRPGQGRAELCRQHSLIASAEAERRQQLDFLLLIPGESREKSAESKPPSAGLVLKAWFWPAVQGRQGWPCVLQAVLPDQAQQGWPQQAPQQ